MDWFRRKSETDTPASTAASPAPEAPSAGLDSGLPPPLRLTDVVRENPPEAAANPLPETGSGQPRDPAAPPPPAAGAGAGSAPEAAMPPTAPRGAPGGAGLGLQADEALRSLLIQSLIEALLPRVSERILASMEAHFATYLRSAHDELIQAVQQALQTSEEQMRGRVLEQMRAELPQELHQCLVEEFAAILRPKSAPAGGSAQQHASDASF